MTVCRCGARWSARALCHCAACHRSFSALQAFDRHQRTGPGREVACLDPAAAGLALRDGVWRQPGSRPAFWAGAAP